MIFVTVKIFDDSWDIAQEHKKIPIEEAVEKLREYALLCGEGK